MTMFDTLYLTKVLSGQTVRARMESFAPLSVFQTFSNPRLPQMLLWVTLG